MVGWILQEQLPQIAPFLLDAILEERSWFVWIQRPGRVGRINFRFDLLTDVVKQVWIPIVPESL